MEKYAATPKKRREKKGLTIFLVVLVVLLTIAVAAAVWVVSHYHIVSGAFYPKNAAVLDLREEKIEPSHFDKVKEKLPNCNIRWNIPFQGGTLADDVTEITVTTLTEEDVQILDYATDLKTVQAENCSDYEALEMLRQRMEN